MQELGPYDYLHRFFRLCIVHFQRNIKALGDSVKGKVQAAMYSLASAEHHPDIQQTLDIIRQGGRKQKLAWLMEKENSKFALPALYQPLSLIPPYIWKASPSTTNGNEQAHHNVNCDGMGLTLLAGIMHGYQYNLCTMSSMDLHQMYGIGHQDAASMHVHRAKHAVSRKG
ncbi:hypothetical protein PAXRUDRAFT_173493 [Paxillus rubicundulus Ve08.2h10]|uniref:Uncharacterized protein n=1 Tax=Paxillus rubicundulus Ve08.2h10 TaxID=930991 RepID=A0A0D0DCW4_9AGAM|nr:hypothetical protein PAXRUDRAFT_173493 [Paxillus rubicundulus Ve08.2h10]